MKQGRGKSDRTPARDQHVSVNQPVLQPVREREILRAALVPLAEPLENRGGRRQLEGRAINQTQGVMTDKDSTPASNAVKDPDDWKTGEEPMTGAQSSYLHTLAEQAGKPDVAEGELTKAEASRRIDTLREDVGLASKEQQTSKDKQGAKEKQRSKR